MRSILSRKFKRRFCSSAVLAVLAACFAMPGAGARAEDSPFDITPFRIGFSLRLFAEVNVNDAKAVVKVWAQTVAKERGIPVDPEPRIMQSVDAMDKALRDGTLDALGLTSDDYRNVSRNAKLDTLFVALQNGRTNVEYLVLVRKDGNIQDLANLRGRNLACYRNPRTSLAQAWLDTSLVEQGFNVTTGFFGRVMEANKVSAAVLPVFFKQIDACLVDRGSFDTMNELNPQIGNQLKVLAVSPPLVPMVFVLRSDYSPALKARIVPALRDLHSTAAGRQVLIVFQMERLVASSPSCLDSAYELLATHQQLCDPAKRALAQTQNASQRR